MKKLISAVLSVCLSAGIAVGAYAVEYGEELQNIPAKTYEQKFSDVSKTHWAFSYVAEMVERGVLNGYPDGKFYPDSQVTRAEFAKIMTTAAGLSLAEPTMQIFADVKTTDWYAPYVHTAKEYLSAYNQNASSYYLPNSPALREDIAVALVKLKGYSTVGADMTALSRMFSDYKSISESAQIYVAAAIENGLISGYDDGTFRGQNSITRAEAATLLWRAYQYGSANKSFDTEATAKPTATAKPQTTVTATAKPQATSAIKQDISEAEKPYVMKKLASANPINPNIGVAFTDGNLYYADESDNCVYKINVSGGSKAKYMSTSSLKYTETEIQENEITETVTETVETGEFETVTETVEEQITETVETGEFEEVEETVTETVINEETGEAEEVTKTVTKQVPVTKEVTKTVPKIVTKQVPVTEEVTKEVTKTVKEEVTVAEYTDFVPTQVFYDDVNNKILLAGYYTQLSQAFKTSKTGKYFFVYDITGSSAVPYCIPAYSSSRVNINIDVILNSGFLVSGDEKINIETGKAEQMDPCHYIEKYGNNLYGLYYNVSYAFLYKYDFNDSEFKRISDAFEAPSFGYKDGRFYFLNTDGEIYTVSVRTGETETLDINTKSENVEFADMGNMSNISEKFYVIDDSTLIFYDTSMKAFRILEKN